MPDISSITRRVESAPDLRQRRGIQVFPEVLQACRDEPARQSER